MNSTRQCPYCHGEMILDDHIGYHRWYCGREINGIPHYLVIYCDRSQPDKKIMDQEIDEIQFETLDSTVWWQWLPISKVFYVHNVSDGTYKEIPWIEPDFSKFDKIISRLETLLTFE